MRLKALAQKRERAALEEAATTATEELENAVSAAESTLNKKQGGQDTTSDNDLNDAKKQLKRALVSREIRLAKIRVAIPRSPPPLRSKAHDCSSGPFIYA